MTPYAHFFNKKPLTLALSALLFIFFFYFVLTYSLPAGLSEKFPTTALYLNSSFPEARVFDVEQNLQALVIREKNKRAALKQAANSTDKSLEVAQQNSSETDASVTLELNKLSNEIKSALIQDPLNARAFRLLGQIYGLQGESANLQKIMAFAARLSPHEIIALDYMTRRSLEDRKYKTALFYADRLFSAGPGLISYYGPIFGRLIDYEPARRDLIAKLAERPSWRLAFFLYALKNSGLKDVYAPTEVFLGLKQTSAPPNEQELSGYLNFLILNKRYDLAYAAWLNFLDADDTEALGFIFNGSFERDISRLPFDWTIGRGVEVNAQVATLPGEETRHGLNIEFGQGRAVFPPVYEVLVLAPGKYHLKGSLRGEIIGRRGLQWSVKCVEGTSTGEGDMVLGRFRDWKPFEFDFDIPEKSCSAQYLQLKHASRSPSEQIASGSIWFDELSIERVEAEKNIIPIEEDEN
jgi:hypothetical protein